MKNPHIDNILEPILTKDTRYTTEAYLFVRDGLDHTVQNLDTPRHVSGQELLGGMRDYALAEYGPVTKRVLSEWGIKECVDFGNIVFNMISVGLLGKTDEDSIEDFMGGYDFHEAFILPFKPQEPVACLIEQSVTAD
ncbi:MAG: Minf_1886 family protein [Pontiella sp.]